MAALEVRQTALPAEPPRSAPVDTEAQPSGTPAAALPSDEALDEVQLDAAKLHVYQVALGLHAQCSIMVAMLHRVLRDQLERASLSVVLNTAETMVPQCLHFLDDHEKRRDWNRQVVDSTSIRKPRRRPWLT